VPDGSVDPVGAPMCGPCCRRRRPQRSSQMPSAHWSTWRTRAGRPARLSKRMSQLHQQIAPSSSSSSPCRVTAAVARCWIGPSPNA